MELKGLHILLTYQCTFEYDHCFVWGSPNQSGEITLEKLRDVFRQAKETGTVDLFLLVGIEFGDLYYPTLEGFRAMPL